MTSVVLWEHDSLKTTSTERSDNITLVSHKIQLSNGDGIRSLSSRDTSTLVCCQDGSVLYCPHDSEHPAAEKILTKLAPVKILKNEKVIQVAAGDSHNVVLTDDHRVQTWGKNDCGQLGRAASRKNIGKPKLVKFPASHCMVQISCGSAHTLALSNDGLVFAWGFNVFGQLGLGKNTFQQNLPEVISSLKGIPVMQITAGSNHSFLLSKSGSVYGWGRNVCGQLGLNNTENSDTPKKCKFFNDKKVKYICCGESHTACLTKDGSVFTFGAGSHGQLGHCSNSNEITPKQVMQLSGCVVTQIACGSNHTLTYVPKSGRLHIFGFGGSGHFSVMEEENENCHISLSGSFVQISDNQSATLCLSKENQDQQHRIKTIHAGGNHSFITVVAAKQTCLADDHRNEDPSKQILTLSQQTINMLYSLSSDAKPPEEIEKIFTSASCLNSLFLLPNDEHYGDSSEKHGVDLNAVQEFFQKLKEKPNMMKCIHDTIQNNLVPQLSPPSADGEAIRIYLILPECDLFDRPEFYHPLICQFAKSFLGLNNKAIKIFTSWCTCNQAAFFKKLVKVFKQCAQYLLQLPYSKNSRKDVERNKDLLPCLEALKVLYQVNEEKYIIHPHTFILPELKDTVDIPKEYINLCRSQLIDRRTEMFTQFLQYLVQEMNTNLPLEAPEHAGALGNEKAHQLANNALLLAERNVDKAYIINAVRNILASVDTSTTERRLNNIILTCFQSPMLKQDLNFCNYPFLFDGEMKSILFQIEAKLKMLTAQVSEFVQNPLSQIFYNVGNYFCNFFVDRQNIVDATFNILSLTDSIQLQKPLLVQFYGEKACGPGVKKEFFKLLFQEGQALTNCFFTEDDVSKRMWFNTTAQHDIEQTHLIGILCGLVIYNFVAINLHFPLAIYKKLLNRPVILDDVKELMPEVGRGLQDVLDYDGDDFEDLFNLTFEFASIELFTGGADRTVTQSNKKVYVNLAVDHILNKSVKVQFDAFSEGFYTACGDTMVSMFQPEELRSLMEGNEDYDFYELEKNTTYLKDYCRKHQTIKFFWEVFHEISLAEKKKFLLFLTGSDRISVTGMKDISISIQPREEEDGLLPFAFTCHKILSLPRYTTKEQLQESLLLAIQQTEGFWLNE